MSNEIVKEFELIAVVKQKAIVEYDKKGIEDYVAMVESKYQDVVFTEEEVKTGTEERAKLNKLSKAIDEYRKNITEELTSDIKAFESDFKSYAERVTKVSKNIDVQVKVFEEREIEKRLEISKNYMVSMVAIREQYKEFLPQLLELVEQNKIFTLKGSYTEKGEVSKKLSDFITQELMKYDEIIAARKAQEELLQQKRDLIISQCKAMTEMFELKLELSPKQFAYLKDYELTAITTEIQRIAKEQSEKEVEAVKKIEEEATRKAQEELEKARIEEENKKIQESKVEEEEQEEFEKDQKELESMRFSEPKTVEIKDSIQPPSKLFYGVIEFEGITIAEATAFRKFLDENNIKFKTIKSEVK